MHVRRLAVVVALVLLAACRPSRTTEIAIPIDVTDAAAPGEQRASSVVSSDAAASVAPTPGGGAPSSLDLLSDGTLVIANEHQVATRAATGVIARHALPHGATARTSPELAGVVIDGGDGVVELLATPSLASLYRGKGTVPFGAPSVVVTEGAAALLLQHEGRLLRLALPKAGAEPRLETVVPVASGTRLNVSITTDHANAASGEAPVTTGHLFDVSKGTLLGRGIPLASIPVEGPRGAHTGDLGFAIAGSRVMRIDLKTANVLKQSTVRCAKGETPLNPTPSPSGALLLVTCGGDAVVLDGVTLAEKRRIKNMMPGCDNGNDLGGVVLADGHTLRLEGCGGEARIDLDRGVYTCGDSAGIVGAPYMMVAGPGGTMAPQAPAARATLPPCTKDLTRSTSSFGTSGRYRLVHGERLTIEHARGVITLEDDGAAVPVIARDEASFAYLRGDKVVVRSVPAGKVLLELSPFAP